MSTFARVRDGQVEGLFDLTDEQYAAMLANGKAAFLRYWIVDPKPEVGPAQVLEDGPVVITHLEARKTWLLREKTQTELDYEASLQ